MVRIGTWKKIRESGNDLVEYENSKRISVKVFRSPRQHVGYDSEGRGGYIIPASKEWSVSIKRPHQLYEYLTGGNSIRQGSTKKIAFELARSYMKEHP